MNKETIKFYMNNPCTIIRDMGNGFSEIKVLVKFVDDIDGSLWCNECMVGNQGTPTTHKCDEYQAIIDYIADVDNCIFCIAENRLIHDEPIEMKAIKGLQDQIKALHRKSKGLKESYKKWETKIGAAGVRHDLLTDGVIALKKAVDNANNQYVKALEQLDGAIEDIDEVSIQVAGTGELISLGALKKLIKSDNELRALNRGGVDSWEWYSESTSCLEDVSEFNLRDVSGYINSL